MENQNNVWDILKTIVAIIVGVISVFTFVWYIIVDRFKYITLIKKNVLDIKEIREDIEVLKEENYTIDEIRFNLKRLMEANNLKWEKFRNGG